MADEDFSSERGAHELARRISSYWAARDCKVNLRVQVVEGVGKDRAVWAVRSDLGLFVPTRNRAG
jgi:hypothetical protein